MAEQVADQISQFPAPPSFYKLYKDGPGAGPPPPPLPQEQELNVLAFPFNLHEPFIPNLEVTRLFTPGPDGSLDVKAELLKLSKGLLFVFLELLTTLVEQPSEAGHLLTAVLTNLENQQYLINTLRPHQARHTLEYLLKTQIQQKRDALQRIQQQTKAIQTKLAQAAQELLAAGGDTAESAPPQQGAAEMDTT